MALKYYIEVVQDREGKLFKSDCHGLLLLKRKI